MPLGGTSFYIVFNNAMVRNTFLIANHPSSYTVKKLRADYSQVNVAGAQAISEGGVATFFIQDVQLFACYKFF
jgi:hypothetical protein